MRVIPLRNLVLVRFEQEDDTSTSGLHVVRDPKLVRPAKVLAVGPECRDMQVGMVALVNSVAGTQIGEPEQLLVPETAIVGVL